QCANHLKQLGLALHNYHAAFGTLPYGSGDCCVPLQPPKPYSTHGGIWPTMILPQIEQTGLHDAIDFNLHTKQLPQQILETVIPTYICPSDAGASDAVLDKRFHHNPETAMGLWYTGSMGPTNPDFCFYCPADLQTPGPGNWCCQGHNFGTRAGLGYPEGTHFGVFGRFHTAVKFSDIRDGLSNTIMLGETLPRQSCFISAFAVNFNVSPTNIPLNTFDSDGPDGNVPWGTNWYRTSGFKSRHPGGATFCLADGSVRFLPESIDFQLYNELGSRAGGEVVNLP
ncbi:MAG: DUF1559 domain-containing protein, partial [Planctomycetales bacterium]|nr:DUF1559 domain-containing protein [Planctomycetales bacterium]